MLPIAAVCMPVLAILIVGLIDERRYLRGVRRVRGIAVPPLPVPLTEQAADPSDRSAA